MRTEKEKIELEFEDEKRYHFANQINLKAKKMGKQHGIRWKGFSEMRTEKRKLSLNLKMKNGTNDVD